MTNALLRRLPQVYLHTHYQLLRVRFPVTCYIAIYRSRRGCAPELIARSFCLLRCLITQTYEMLHEANPIRWKPFSMFPIGRPFTARFITVDVRGTFGCDAHGTRISYTYLKLLTRLA